MPDSPNKRRPNKPLTPQELEDARKTEQNRDEGLTSSQQEEDDRSVRQGAVKPRDSRSPRPGRRAPI